MPKANGLDLVRRVVGGGDGLETEFPAVGRGTVLGILEVAGVTVLI